MRYRSRPGSGGRSGLWLFLDSRSDWLVATRLPQVVNHPLHEIHGVRACYLVSHPILHDDCHGPREDFCLVYSQLVHNSVVLRMNDVNLVVIKVVSEIGI